MIFGELPPPTADELFSWLKVAAMLAGLWLLGLKIAEHYKAKPPLDKQLAALRSEFLERFATRQQLADGLQDINRRIDDREIITVQYRQELKEELAQVGTRLTERTNRIFDELRALGREMSHLSGRMESLIKERP